MAKVWTKALEPPESENDHDAMVAVWPDGSKWEVNSLTYAEWKQQQELSNGKGKLWEGKHKSTGHPVWVHK
eukprot:9454563-Karenia_brevis.AAC.1